jgi:hypothetical protein
MFSDGALCKAKAEVVPADVPSKYNVTVSPLRTTAT